MNLHKGKILKNAIEESGVTITSLIGKLKKSNKHIKCSRTKLYQLFKQEEIDDDFLQIIGKVIYYDFSQDIPTLKKETGSIVGENDGTNYQLKVAGELVFIRGEHARLQRSYIELLSILTKFANQNDDTDLKEEIAHFLEKGTRLNKTTF